MIQKDESKPGVGFDLAALKRFFVRVQFSRDAFVMSRVLSPLRA